MRVFEDITLAFGEDEYVVGGDDSIMMLIGKVESFITLQELSSGKIPPLSTLAAAYATALQHAGATVSSAEVYASLFGSGQTSAANAVAGLLAMMVPPSALRDNAGKPKAKAPAKRKQAQSRKRTK